MSKEIKIEDSKVARDWKEIVEKSNGQMIYCPDNLVESAKEWYKKREHLNQEFLKLSKVEVETKVLLENVALDVRRYLESVGNPLAWTGEVGFESEALKEGVWIVSVLPGK